MCWGQPPGPGFMETLEGCAAVSVVCFVCVPCPLCSLHVTSTACPEAAGGKAEAPGRRASGALALPAACSPSWPGVSAALSPSLHIVLCSYRTA